MEQQYSHILASVTRHPWAIAEDMWAVIQGLLELRARGERLSDAEIRAAIGAEREPARAMRVGPVTVLPLRGVLAQHMDALLEVSGGTSTDRYARDVRAALRDRTVEAIVLDVHSPGGSLYGVEEAAAVVRAGRTVKPIVAVANSLAASAAYWIASAAGQVVAAPNADIGSIGVFTVHRDESQALEQLGVKLSVIKAGRYKAEGGSHEPLADDARGRIQARVDAAYGEFVSAVARSRGVPERVVRKGYGEGQVLGARAALAAGMIDRIATLQGTVDSLSTAEGRQAVMAGGLSGRGALAASAIPTHPADARQWFDLAATGDESPDARLRRELRELDRTSTEARSGTARLRRELEAIG